MEADISIWQKPGHFYFALTSHWAVMYLAPKDHTVPTLSRLSEFPRRRSPVEVFVSTMQRGCRACAKAAVGDGNYD